MAVSLGSDARDPQSRASELMPSANTAESLDPLCVKRHEEVCDPKADKRFFRQLDPALLGDHLTSRPTPRYDAEANPLPPPSPAPARTIIDSRSVIAWAIHH